MADKLITQEDFDKATDAVTAIIDAKGLTEKVGYVLIWTTADATEMAYGGTVARDDAAYLFAACLAGLSQKRGREPLDG